MARVSLHTVYEKTKMKVMHTACCVWSFLLYLVYPPVCAACRNFMEKRTGLCDACMSQITPIASYSFAIGKRYTVPVFAVSQYKDPLRSLILAKHYSDKIAAFCLADLMWHKTYISQQKFDYLVPIPLHWSRYAWRGFNQADEIAKQIAQKSEIPVAHLIKRNKKTLFQAELSADERTRNVRDAFVLDVVYKKHYSDKHLVLVDDLFTTGATVQEAARTLARLKPASIAVLVAARVI